MVGGFTEWQSSRLSSLILRIEQDHFQVELGRLISLFYTEKFLQFLHVLSMQATGRCELTQ